MRAIWLKSQREHLGYSQEELAAQLQLAGIDISRAAISGWENGYYSPPLEDNKFRIALAQALQISVTDLLARAGFEVETGDLSAIGWEAAQLVENLPPDQQRVAIKILRALAEG